MKFLSISHCVATRHLIQALTINMVPLSTYNQCTVSSAPSNNNNDPQYTMKITDKRIDRFPKSRQEQIGDRLQNLEQTLKPCPQSPNKNLTLYPKFTFVLHQTVVDTFLIINLNNSNNFNKF